MSAVITKRKAMQIPTQPVTTDGGKTWKLVENNKPSGFRECVVWKASSNIAITVGPNGSDISYDNGKNWRNFSNSRFSHRCVFTRRQILLGRRGRGKISKLTWAN